LLHDAVRLQQNVWVCRAAHWRSIANAAPCRDCCAPCSSALINQHSADYKIPKPSEKEPVMDAQTETHAELADDFLFGAEQIADYLTSIGLPTTVNGIYYAFKRGSLPIGKYGKCLISSRKKLTRKVQSLVVSAT
jgi:hypothetical protein